MTAKKPDARIPAGRTMYKGRRLNKRSRVELERFVVGLLTRVGELEQVASDKAMEILRLDRENERLGKVIAKHGEILTHKDESLRQCREANNEGSRQLDLARGEKRIAVDNYLAMKKEYGSAREEIAGLKRASKKADLLYGIGMLGCAVVIVFVVVGSVFHLWG